MAPEIQGDTTALCFRLNPSAIFATRIDTSCIRCRRDYQRRVLLEEISGQKLHIPVEHYSAL